MLKIVTEDEELEEFAMSEDSMIAVPIQVDKSPQGDVTVTVYSRFKDIALELTRIFDDPASDDAVRFLTEKLSPHMNGSGFYFEREYDHNVINFTADDGVRDVDVPGDCEIVYIDTMERAGEYYFNTARDLEIDDDDPADAAFAAVSDSVVMSVASVNDYTDDDTVEINVECAKEYRNRGYATAVTAALCRYLTGIGERVSYRCRKSNLASLAVAEKCGLKYTGETFSFVCYRN